MFQKFKSKKISSSSDCKSNIFFKYSLLKNVSLCNRFAYRLIVDFFYFSLTKVEQDEMRNISQINRAVENELAQQWKFMRERTKGNKQMNETKQNKPTKNS